VIMVARNLVFSSLVKTVSLKTNSERRRNDEGANCMCGDFTSSGNYHKKSV
jgi:hypothetical protein